MGSRGRNKKHSVEKYDGKNKILFYSGLSVIFLLAISGISYRANKLTKDDPEYIEQRLIEFYEDSCQLNPKVGFKTVNGLRGAYAKGNFKKNEQVLFGGQGLFFIYGFCSLATPKCSLVSLLIQ